MAATGAAVHHTTPPFCFPPHALNTPQLIVVDDYETPASLRINKINQQIPEKNNEKFNHRKTVRLCLSVYHRVYIFFHKTMDPLQAIFDNYKLDELDRTWINQVCQSDYKNIENVPIDYHIFLESSDMLNLLKETCNIVKNWIYQNHDVRVNDRDEVSWETLIAMNLEIQALQSILAYLMQKGQSFDSNQESRQICLAATSLYFILLSIPGANTFQAFQTCLYEIALKSLEISQNLSSTRNSEIPEISDDYDNEPCDEPQNSLSRTQSLALIRALNGVMYELVNMLDSARTTFEIRSLEITIYYLIEMTKLADETIDPKRPDEATTSSLAYNAYVALEKICNPKYSAISVITRIIAKYALPQFLVTTTCAINKHMTIVRQSTLYFFKNLLNNHENEARESIIILIQHIMFKCPEKLDGRQKQAAIVVKLLYLCCNDDTTLRRCIKDLASMSYHNKISSRIFAQEIIAKFLMEIVLSRTQSGSENFAIFSNCKIEEILLSSAIAHCIDCSSMVRGRAIATLAEYTNFIERPAIKKLFQNCSAVSDETREIPSLENIKETLDNDDDSSMPDSEAIISMLKDRLEDDRALVRRSALQVMQNGIRVEPELLKIALPLVLKRCRDAIPIVRRCAIRVLTNLLEAHPATQGLCKDWVNSVVPMIFDSETKIQEEVFDSLGKLTIDVIRKHCNDYDNSEELAWRIITEISRNKMSDHLSKACAVWLEEKRITDLLINYVKTHIGTRNNACAWLILASISDNKNLPKISNYYRSYGQNLVEMTNSDVCLAYLSLRVLKNCWSTFEVTILRDINEDLVNYLKNYRLCVALIRQCLEIVLELTKYLTDNREDCEFMKHLVELSEETISRIIDNENLNTEDDTLFPAICTLGHASFFSWTKITLETRRLLQRFLLEWTSLPVWMKDRKELQGAAITVLGQQSLIDRDIAVEMTPIFGRLLCNNRSLQNGAVSREQDGAVSIRQDGRRFSSSESTFSRLNNEDDMANGPIVRINAAKALADICVRFTSLVEPYLTDMCISMKDPDPVVREVILVIFIQLLVEDTIMIKESYFYHILTMLADDDTEIRRMTLFLIKERLIAKNKNLLTQQFLNGIYHFNDYERLNTTIKRRRRSTTNQSGILSLAGEENVNKRRMIYDFMLENLDPPGKLKIILKITGHILNPRSNADLDVCDEKGISILRDAIYVVSSEHLQANSTFTRQSLDDESNNNGTDETTSSPANSVIHEAMKKHRNEYFLPVIVELRKHCGAMKSKFYDEITKFLARTINDSSKDALTSLYNEYPKLEREIQREIRKHSKQSRDNLTVDNNDREVTTNSRDLTIKKIDNLARNSLLIDPERMPRIVLRRLSSLMYPGNGGCNSTTRETRDDDEEKKISTGTRKSEGKNRSRR